jgi:hypothetical protein
MLGGLAWAIKVIRPVFVTLKNPPVIVSAKGQKL